MTEPQSTTGDGASEAEGRRGPVSARAALGMLAAALWAASMLAIWRHETGLGGRELAQAGISPQILLVTWTGYEHWLWILQDERRIGATRLTVMRDETEVGAGRLPGYEMTSRTRMSPRLLGMEFPIEINLAVSMNAGFEMRSLKALVQVAGRPARLHAFVEGRDLYYRIMGDRPGDGDGDGDGAAALGGLIPRDAIGRVTLEGPILLQEIVTPLLVHDERRLRAGDSWTLRASNPLGGMLDRTIHVTVAGQEELTVSGRPIKAWRVTERIGPMRSEAWYGPGGRLLRRRMDNGLVLLEAQPEEVKQYDLRFGVEAPLLAIDRDHLRANVDPGLDGQPLQNLLPGLALP